MVKAFVEKTTRKMLGTRVASFPVFDPHYYRGSENYRQWRQVLIFSNLIQAVGFCRRIS